MSWPTAGAPCKSRAKANRRVRRDVVGRDVMMRDVVRRDPPDTRDWLFESKARLSKKLSDIWPVSLLDLGLLTVATEFLLGLFRSLERMLLTCGKF
jgi:hypothetical protein